MFCPIPKGLRGPQKDSENVHHSVQVPRLTAGSPRQEGRGKGGKRGANLLEEDRERTQQKMTAGNSECDLNTHPCGNGAFLEGTDELAIGCNTVRRMRSEQLGCREPALHIPPLFQPPRQGVGVTSRHLTLTHSLSWVQRGTCRQRWRAVPISSQEWEELGAPLEVPQGLLALALKRCQQGAPGLAGKFPHNPWAATQTHRVKSPSRLLFALQDSCP